MTLAQKLRKAVGEFEATQVRYRELGAEDTEPCCVFNSLVRRAQKFEPIAWGNVDWDLYSGMPGVKQAERALTAKMKKVVKLVQEAQRVTEGLTIPEL